MPDTESKSPKISEGLFLAFASAGLYLFTFYYEKGYASVFKIPVSLITLDIKTILSFGVVFLTIFTVLFVIINFLALVTMNTLHPVILRNMVPLLPVAFFLLAQIYIYGIANWQKWVFFLGLFLYFTYLQFIFPLRTQKNGSYREKLEAQQKHEQKITDLPILLRKRFGNDALVVVIVFLIGIAVSENIGIAEAMSQKDFLVTNTIPKMVVLRIYGDNMVCAPFDEKTGEVKSSFTILKVGEDVGMTLNLKTLKALHPAVPVIPTVLPSATPIPPPLPTSTP